jgi:hypothetical protein
MISHLSDEYRILEKSLESQRGAPPQGRNHVQALVPTRDNADWTTRKMDEYPYICARLVLWRARVSASHQYETDIRVMVQHKTWKNERKKVDERKLVWNSRRTVWHGDRCQPLKKKINFERS